MLFNSQIFVFLFLPVVLIGYYSLHKFQKHTAAKVFLICASFWFYGYNCFPYLLILIGSIVVNYLFFILIGRIPTEKQILRKLCTAIGVALNLSSIFFFKYYDFFIRNLNSVFHTDMKLLQVALPLGISFFTFQQISFLVDTYRNETGAYRFIDYCLYVSFFPQLIAGPIVLHKDLIHQFSEPKRYLIQKENLLIGTRYFVIGLFKKTMVADRLSLLVATGYETNSFLSSFGAVMVILAYTLQIYFDFSGYSDMAIGLGKLLGYDLPVNFYEPYKAKTISEFWKRWHMTMTRFFTQYVYIPLGGSRRGPVRTCINILIVFCLSGLWHGAGWTFVFWGLLHGIALVFHRVFGKQLSKLPGLVIGFLTFCYVNMAWVFFRADSFLQAKNILACVLKGGFSRSNQLLFESLCGDNLMTMVNLFVTSPALQQAIYGTAAVVFILLVLAVALRAPSSHALSLRTQIGKYEGIVLGLMAVCSVMTFMNVSEFLYFNF